MFNQGNGRATANARPLQEEQLGEAPHDDMKGQSNEKGFKLEEYGAQRPKARINLLDILNESCKNSVHEVEADKKTRDILGTPSKSKRTKSRISKILQRLQAEPLRKHFMDGQEEFGIDNDRLVYEPQSLGKRLSQGMQLNPRLYSATCVDVPYRRWCQYLLIFLLLTIGLVLTPRYIPKWVGFKVRSVADICKGSDEELLFLKYRLRKLAEIPKSRSKIAQQVFDENCMNNSAANFYRRPGRFQWPYECSSELAVKASAEEVCVGPMTKNSCAVADAEFEAYETQQVGICETFSIPKTCKLVINQTREEAVLEIERDHNTSRLISNNTKAEIIGNAAVDKGIEAIHRLRAKVDIASDIYIVYQIFGLIVGAPLIVYHRGVGSQVLYATFGIKKSTFIGGTVVFLLLFDSATQIFRNKQLPRFVDITMQDPCYLDQKFGRERIELVLSTCNEVSELALNSSTSTQRMDEVYYRAKRFALCHEPIQEHPGIKEFDEMRRKYRDGNLRFRGKCNSTHLAEKTASPLGDESKFSKVKGLVASGLIAQLFLKMLLATWTIHLMSIFEPMVTHAGKVEVFGPRKDGSMELSRREIRSVVRFARDKHIFPLLVLSCLMVVEVALIVCGLSIDTAETAKDIEEQKEAIIFEQVSEIFIAANNRTCPLFT